MGRIVEGFWDCTNCGHKKIRGGIRVCPNCGKTRSEETRFYLSSDSRYVPRTEANRINRNPDWVCKNCKQLNSDSDKVCPSCGIPRTESNLDYFDNHERLYQEALDEYNKEYEEYLKECEEYDKSLDSHGSLDSHNSYSASDYRSSPDYRSPSDFHDSLSNTVVEFLSANGRSILMGLLIILALSGIIFLIVPKNKEITIREMSWQRCIDIQEYKTVNESDWYLPSGARLQYTRWEFSHYEQVLDHYETVPHTTHEDLGNGYFEEHTTYTQEPVYRPEAIYRTKYYYEIERWIYERSVTTEGNDKEPYWGETNLSEVERVSNKRESYSIIGLDEKGKELNLSLSFDDWNSLRVGRTFNFKVSLGHATLARE